jgi:competence protein ComEA
MRRQSSEEVAEAAHRRLQLLAEELARSGLAPHRVAGGDERSEPLEQPCVVPTAGRHVRRRALPAGTRLSGWIGDRLPPWLQGRVALGPRHLVVVLVLGVLAVAAAGCLALRPGHDTVVRGDASAADLSPPAGGAASAAPAGASGSPSAGSTSGLPGPGAQPTGLVVVDVAGKVRRPGICRLPAGSRVQDALRLAGGARRGVDLTALNLARVLVDGEQIVVGEPAPPGVAASAASAPGAAQAPTQLVNLNTATLDELESLPGVGPVTAQKILDWRAAHDAFTSVDELLEVDGIGEKTMADLAPYVTL